MVDRISVLCDPCLGEGREVTAGRLVIALGGRKPASIDLCEDCQTSMVKPLLDVLTSHGRTEVGSTPKAGRPGDPTACPDCGVMFPSKQGMTLHRTLKHEESVDLTDDVPLSKQFVVCPECSDGRTLRASSMEIHYRKNHPDAIWPGPEDGTVECPHCVRRTHTARGLSSHLRNSHPREWAKRQKVKART